MTHDSYTEAERKLEWHGTKKAYFWGFFLAILLTLASYFLVVEHILSGWTLILTIIGLGIVQMGVHLLFFLHLAEGKKPHWNLVIFFFMLLVVVILIAGSLWIMYDLEDRVMPTMEFHEEGI